MYRRVQARLVSGRRYGASPRDREALARPGRAGQHQLAVARQFRKALLELGQGHDHDPRYIEGHPAHFCPLANIDEQAALADQPDSRGGADLAGLRQIDTCIQGACS